MTYSPLKRFWNLLKLYKKEVRQIYILAVLIGFINLTLPLGIQAIINFLLIGEYTSTWLLLVAFVLFGVFASGWLQINQLKVVEKTQQDIFARSAFEFAYRLPRISIGQLNKANINELANRFFDTLTIQKGIPKILIDISQAIFQIILGLILLAIYSPYFIILGFVFAFMLWLIIKLTGPTGLSSSIKESKYKYQMAHWLEEIARLNRSFKFYEQPKLHLDKTDNIANNYLEARQSHFGVLLNQFKMFVALKIIIAAGLLLLGGFLVFQEQINIGQFVAAEIIILLLINSIDKLLTSIDVFYDVLTALDKIGHVTDLELDSKFGSATINRKQGLSVKAQDVSFAFPDDKKKILDKLSFSIASNENVVLSGKSGSGKSILLQILAGLHKIEDGDIYINDIPIDNYDRKSYYASIGVSLPINQIFKGSIRDNITLGRAIDEKELATIINVLSLNDYLAHQPNGLGSLVDTGGRKLPRSVIQKIIVARLIIGKPKLLLIEDPLSFISIDEKNKIIDYLVNKERDWTLIVISDYQYWNDKSDREIILNKN